MTTPKIIKIKDQNYSAIYITQAQINFYFTEKGFDGIGVDVEKMSENEQDLITELCNNLRSVIEKK